MFVLASEKWIDVEMNFCYVPDQRERASDKNGVKIELYWL